MSGGMRKLLALAIFLVTWNEITAERRDGYKGFTPASECVAILKNGHQEFDDEMEARAFISAEKTGMGKYRYDFNLYEMREVQ